MDSPSREKQIVNVRGIHAASWPATTEDRGLGGYLKQRDARSIILNGNGIRI